MNRGNFKKTTPLVLGPLIKLPLGRTPPVLSEKDLERLIAAQILCGLLANERKAKLDVDNLVEISVQCAAKILNLTQ